MFPFASGTSLTSRKLCVRIDRPEVEPPEVPPPEDVPPPEVVPLDISVLSRSISLISSTSLPDINRNLFVS